MKILLVDNEPEIAELLLTVLKDIGPHDIRTANSGGTALQTAAAMGGVDLLVTDVVMEPMNGFMLRDQIAKRYPASRVMFISGFDLSDYQEQIAGLSFIQKPFELPYFIELVQKELTIAASLPASEITASPLPGPAPDLEATASFRPPTQLIPRPSGVRAVAQPSLAAVPVVGMASSGAKLVGATAQPKATQTAVAVAIQPSIAQPVVAKISATAQPSIAKPSIVAQPASAAAAVATPSAPVRPAAAPQARVVLPAARPEAEAQSHPASLIGGTLGAYKIIRQLGEGQWGPVYAAIQISINRSVGLKILAPDRAKDLTLKSRFVSDARAKANVQHPSILSVYEAGEVDGYSFYAHEFVDGRSLADLIKNGEKLSEAEALKVLRAAAEGLAYLQANHLAHSALDAAHIYVPKGAHPRLANIATQAGGQELTPEKEIRTLGTALMAVLTGAQNLSEGLKTMLDRMVKPGPNTITTWAVLLHGLKALEPKIIPVEAAKISAQDRAAIAAVEAARRDQSRSLWMTVAILIISLITVGTLIYYKFRSNERNLTGQIEIPEANYPIGSDNKPTHINQFWIDKYEVTVGQYAKFLAYLDAHPTADGDFNHEKQPRQLSHRPEYWDIYYGNAVAGQSAHGVPMTLNSPVMMITWWDAYAYAKWKKRDLPTEEEWEAAARGPAGRSYPWGNEFKASRVNINTDYDKANPSAKGSVDGFNFWGDVDMMKGDESTSGVIGMAGNVSEWVEWPQGARFPVYKGGNFQSADATLYKRVADHLPSVGEEFIGFRTISRTRPTVK